MKRVLESEPVCPICEKPTAPMSVTISDKAEIEFKALVELMKDSGPQADDKEKNGDEEDDDI